MGVLIRPDYIDRRRQEGNYAAWRDSPIGAGGSYEDYQRWISSMGPSGAAPQPGQQPTPIAPPTAIPGPTSGPPAFAPPQVQMPAMLQNPQPQGLGGMPLIRDRMMGATMSPFAQPNWGIQQVDPTYLTQQMRLPGGNVSATPVATPAPVASGFGNNGTTPSGWAANPLLGSAIGQAAQQYLQATGQQPAPVGLGGKRIPRQPMIGLGTV